MRRILLLLVLLGAQLGLGSVQADGGFVVTRATVELKDQEYLLDAQVDYTFNDTVLEALDNGVPLTMEVHVQVRPKGAWIWTRSLADISQLYLIRYLPLTEVYQVTRLPDGSQQTFVTRAAAIAALGEIDQLPLVARRALEPGERYLIHIKVSLDIEALPLPLRPVAYLKPSWNLSSGWTQWPLDQ
jgi:hypothetical protein